MTGRRSLRTILLLGVSLCTITTAATGGWFVYTLFRNQLHRQLDHSLTDKLRFLRAACSQRDGTVVIETEQALWQRVHDREDPEYFSLQLLDGGVVLLRSESLVDGALPEVGRDSFEPVFRRITLPSGAEGHCAGQIFHPERVHGGQEPLVVHAVVAHDSERILSALRHLRRLLLGVGTISTLLLLGATALIVNRSMRPLRGLARQIEGVAVGDAEARIELPDAQVELEPVVERLNALMDRVAATIERERRFAAGAAHELRNPLAGIRSQIEVALSRGRSTEELRETLERVGGIERRLERVVENLLMLARLQAGGIEPVPGAVDLEVLLQREWEEVAARASEAGLVLSWEVEKGVPPARTSEEWLEIMVRNLLDNAVSHAPKGGSVTVSLASGDEGPAIRIANDNPGLQGEEVGRLFEPFWRKSSAREGGHVHAGLGLDLCRQVATVLGADLEVNLENEGGTIAFLIRLPAGSD